MSQPAVPSGEKAKTTSSSGTIQKKFGFILIIFILLQIPLMMVNGLMSDRQRYNVDYPEEYKGAGAGSQVITGPILTIPYHYQAIEIQEAPQPAVAQKDGVSPLPPAKPQTVIIHKVGYLHFFPETLKVVGNLNPEVRDEGKFKAILYETSLAFQGAFSTSDLGDKKINENDLIWEDASLAMGLSDLRGIHQETLLHWGGQNYHFVPGVNHLKLFDSGQHVAVADVKEDGRYPFSFTLHLNGSRDLNIFPAGKESQVSLASLWPHPTFIGGFLPDKREITPKGFNAVWKVSYFSRNLPQIWTDTETDISKSLSQYMVGVTLATPVEFYRTSIRAIKYGSLLILMTFLTFFIFETISKLRIHAVQYLLVGLALCLFYLLLVSIAEWVPFVWAYTIASIPTISLITLYIRGAISKGKNQHLSLVMAGLLLILYIYLYVLLQLENLSLLFGAVGLFIVLAAVMYVTRNIDWHNEKAPE